jgi:hypothetical protein
MYPTQHDWRVHRQQGDIISLPFFQTKEDRLKRNKVLEDPWNNGRVIFVTSMRSLTWPEYWTLMLPTFDRPAADIGLIEAVETKSSVVYCLDTRVGGIRNHGICLPGRTCHVWFTLYGNCVCNTSSSTRTQFSWREQWQVHRTSCLFVVLQQELTMPYSYAVRMHHGHSAHVWFGLLSLAPHLFFWILINYNCLEDQNKSICMYVPIGPAPEWYHVGSNLDWNIEYLYLSWCIVIFFCDSRRILGNTLKWVYLFIVHLTTLSVAQ